ncbi:hypothetical protein [Pelagicoccus sp. SDUM812002]|uniref:ZIP family metal transporter n=1 Tax=Pelagicoccus sp. SDUM812002 TaxID=3041266 RepID=UPI00280F51FF|nr:hypothetical protein [Pelagicoccus sp. SDUM812002]MDQ8186882.1 hypothetical protein [Pelagicoccus sp. SDUM812002]
MDWILVVGIAWAAGLAMPLGAFFAQIEHIGPNWLENEFRHGVIAFGAGALLSAVALVLVPEGSQAFSPIPASLWLLFGAVSLMGLDTFLSRKKSALGQLVAMLTDFLPEAIALGAAFAHGSSSSFVIALMIGLQNLPEGFNAFREMRSNTSLSKGKITLAFLCMSLLGPAAAALGYGLLSKDPRPVAAIELFAAGGILYLIFQDIAPQVRIERKWAPPLGAVLGFSLGLLGHLYAT